jgi:hypothetical protein
VRPAPTGLPSAVARGAVPAAAADACATAGPVGAATAAFTAAVALARICCCSCATACCCRAGNGPCRIAGAPVPRRAIAARSGDSDSSHARAPPPALKGLMGLTPATPSAVAAGAWTRDAPPQAPELPRPAASSSLSTASDPREHEAPGESRTEPEAASLRKERISGRKGGFLAAQSAAHTQHIQLSHHSRE